MKVNHEPQWANSVLKQNIELFHSEKAFTVGSNPLLLIGGVHGDEPQGVEIVQQTLALLQNDKSLKCNFEWIIIPCLNPDGYSRNERVNGNGVDLNRNFPSSDWQAFVKAPRYHPGTHPASEPEVKALVNMIKQAQPKLIIHCHSWRPCVVYTGSQAKNIAEQLGSLSSTSVHEDIGYPTPGSLGQYGWLMHQIPVICIEADENFKRGETWPIYESGIKDLLNSNLEF